MQPQPVVLSSLRPQQLHMMLRRLCSLGRGGLHRDWRPSVRLPAHESAPHRRCCGTLSRSLAARCIGTPCQRSRKASNLLWCLVRRSSAALACHVAFAGRGASALPGPSSSVDGAGTVLSDAFDCIMAGAAGAPSNAGLRNAALPPLMSPSLASAAPSR